MAVFIAGKRADFQLPNAFGVNVVRKRALQNWYCSHRPMAGFPDPQRTPDERTAHRAVATRAHFV